MLHERLTAAASDPRYSAIAALLLEAAKATTPDDGPFADGRGWVRCGKCDGRLATYEPCENCP